MKQVSVVVSTYTADVSGVCSALYELGGMVVIHDPSGCNSTYNTHDEPRWYDQDSLVFISGLSEIDAIMGNDDKFINDIIRAARDLTPRFIALVRTPVPMMIGTDFAAIREIIEQETGIPTFYFPTNGMHSYIQGVGMALEMVARRMVEKPLQKSPSVCPRVNLLGVTPLDFSINTTLESLRSFFETNGYSILSTFAMGSHPEDIARAGEADINVVVSSAGLSAAKVLYERFQIPYVVGLPTEPFSKKVLAAMKKTLEDGVCRIAYVTEEQRDVVNQEGDILYLIGEAVISQSLAAAISLQYGKNVCVICPLETEEELINKKYCRQADSEEEIAAMVKDAAAVIADPMYQPICPKNVPFFPLPHEAFSGRIYRKQIPDLRNLCFLDTWMDRRFERTGMLIGAEGLKRLADARVAVFGIGGVGGYVVEALARSGVGTIDLIDHDTVSCSNLNRQIIATEETVGRPKVEVMKERILSINPRAQVNCYPCFYLPGKTNLFDFSDWSYVVDAIDTVTAKLDIVEQAQRAGVPVISCMGTGNKMDASRFEVTDIYKTTVCPLAKVMRRELKKRGIRKLKVVYSKEEPIKTGVRTPGSMSYVPPVAGLLAAGEVIKDLLSRS